MKANIYRRMKHKGADQHVSQCSGNSTTWYEKCECVQPFL